MKVYFKFKIAIISFAVSGALLTAFGVAFITFIYASGIDRMDRELRSLVEAPLRGGHPTRYWQDFGKSLAFSFGEGRAEEIALVVFDSDDRVLYQSDNVPVEFKIIPHPAIQKARNRDEGDFGTHFIERIDRDNDGKISAEEFDGPPHMFAPADHNDDGFIDAAEAAHIERPPNRFRGTRLPPGGQEHERPPALPASSRFQSLETADISWRIGIFSNHENTVIAAIDMDSFHRDIHRFRIALIISVPLGLLLLGITGWFLAGRAMKPVAMIADTAEGITAKALDRRIPMVGNDIELERLVTVSNSMLDRLEMSYHQAVRFSADAAHELQTPLTILQGELDNAIQDSEDGSAEQQRYSMLLEELSNLKSVVQKLLLLAHADEGRLNLCPVPVDLSELVQSAAEDIEIMAPELDIECRIAEGITVSADPALLNQVLRNMTSNAAKYANETGQAVFTLEMNKQGIRFTLANTATVIPESDRPLLFERFHRVEKSRTASGSGLGLSLAREIARAHSGDLTLDDYSNGMVSFTLHLPLG
ncbi:MAG: ATP-binding protein [Pontiella sp.]